MAIMEMTMQISYGVVSFDPRGSVKNWQRVDKINQHNNRAEALPHCKVGSPLPVHLIGTGNLQSDIRAKMLAHGINPDAIRKNGVIGFEVILSASHAFFTDEGGPEPMKRTGAWIGTAIQAAERIWEADRIVAAVLHLDEHTPHIHVFVLPLLLRTNKRRPAEGETWTLDARVISGPGKFQRAHDLYAETMQPFGLSRGVERSERKRRPYSDELAKLKRRKEEMDQTIEAAQIAKARFNDLQEAEKARWQEVHREQTRLVNEAETEKRKARELINRLEVERRRHADEVAKLKIAFERSQQTAAKALAFRDALRSIHHADLPANVTEALRLGAAVEQAAFVDARTARQVQSETSDLPVDLLRAARAHGNSRW